MMKRILLMMALAICTLGVSAQTTKVVTGAVIDKNGNPLPNALVEATGGAESVTTDADGSFNIEVPVWLKSLTAKYAGLKDKKINLDGRNQVIFEMKPRTGSWFIDAAVAGTFGDMRFGYAGLMGGFLGNWGGYAKILIPFGGSIDSNAPSGTIGVIKKVAVPVYLYLGMGYAPVWGKYWYNSIHCYHTYDLGMMFDVGAILKFNKVNFGLGYSYSRGFSYEFNNHSIQLSVGYCFE